MQKNTTFLHFKMQKQQKYALRDLVQKKAENAGRRRRQTD